MKPVENGKSPKKVKTVGYGLHHPAAISAQNIQLSMEGIVAEVCGSFGSGQLTSHLLGDINISNLLAVLSVLMILNYSMQNSLAAISVLSTVPGRLQVVSQCHPIVVIDYAHTPDALEKHSRLCANYVNMICIASLVAAVIVMWGNGR